MLIHPSCVIFACAFEAFCTTFSWILLTLLDLCSATFLLTSSSYYSKFNLFCDIFRISHTALSFQRDVSISLTAARAFRVCTDNKRSKMVIFATTALITSEVFRRGYWKASTSWELKSEYSTETTSVFLLWLHWQENITEYVKGDI